MILILFRSKNNIYFLYFLCITCTHENEYLKIQRKGTIKEELAISCSVFSNKYILKFLYIYFFPLDWVYHLKSYFAMQHQSTMGDTAQKEVSIVLSHTAVWSKVLPVCAPPQEHKKGFCVWHLPASHIFPSHWDLSYIVIQSTCNFLKLIWAQYCLSV